MLMSCERCSSRQPSSDETAQPRAERREGACETSAATWAHGSTTRALVADDEVADALFAYERDGDQLAPVERISLRGAERDAATDVEALAWAAAPGAAPTLWLVGSHSRNRHGDWDASRARLRGYIFEPGEDDDGGSYRAHAALDARDWSDAAACAASVVGDGSDELCEAIVRAGGLDIEAAVGDAAGRLWLGLRAPLVDGAAALLRIAPSATSAERGEGETSGGETKVDAIALVHLAGLGFRALTRQRGMIHGVAGPSDDVARPGRVIVWPAEELRPGARIVPAEREHVDSDAEAILVRRDAGGAQVGPFVLRDRGRRGCEPAARFTGLGAPGANGADATMN